MNQITNMPTVGFSNTLRPNGLALLAVIASVICQLLTGSPTYADDAPKETSYRIVSQRLTEGSTYGVFSAVIHSKQELAQYTKIMATPHLEEDQKAVRDMISRIAEDAKINFDKEALVMLPYQECEFANVKLERPTLSDGSLVCGVRRSAPKVEFDEEITNQFCFADDQV